MKLVRSGGEEERRSPVRNICARFGAPDNDFIYARIGDRLGYFALELEPVQVFSVRRGSGRHV